jgi:hypothetical protein
MTKDTRTAAERWLGHKEVTTSPPSADQPPEATQAVGAIMGKSPLDLSEGEIDRSITYYKEARAAGRIKTPEPTPEPVPKRPRRKTAPAQDDLFDTQGD